MLMEGVILAVAGMGTVYLFLMLLVWLMHTTSAMVRVLEEKGLARSMETSGAAPGVGGDMPRIAAVIAVAGRALGRS